MTCKVVLEASIYETIYHHTVYTSDQSKALAIPRDGPPGHAYPKRPIFFQNFSQSTALPDSDWKIVPKSMAESNLGPEQNNCHNQVKMFLNLRRGKRRWKTISFRLLRTFILEHSEYLPHGPQLSPKLADHEVRKYQKFNSKIVRIHILLKEHYINNTTPTQLARKQVGPMTKHTEFKR